MTYKVLDHGYVQLIDHYGDDESIERAARQSYGEGTRQVTKTRGLIRTLMRDRHDSPFEAVDFTIQLKCPIFIARQILRHRLFSVNEVSARYSVLPEEYYIPHIDRICEQHIENKQGSGSPVDLNLAFSVQQQMIESSRLAFETYKRFLDAGIARETARMVLPVNTYTIFTLKGNLRTWLHFLSLRMDPHAQWEVQQYAEAIATHIKEIVPIAYEAWEDYVFNARSFSATEVEVVRDLVHDHTATEVRDLTLQYDASIRGREMNTFINKLGVHDPFLGDD